MIYDKRAAARVIGTIFKHPELLTKTEKYNLTTDDFADPIHRYAFGAIYNLYYGGVQNLDVNIFNDYLSKYPEVWQSFKKGKGEEFLVSAIELGEKNNFDFNYDRVKKLSLLRSLKESGFDISDWYQENLTDIGVKQELEKKIEQAEIREVVNSFTFKISDIESTFINKTTFKVGKATDGLEELMENLKVEPAVGFKLEGKIFTTVVRGARKTKFYLMAGQSGQGKTRIAIANACRLAFPLRWEDGEWKNTGSNQKTLFITTELTFDEIQTIILANISNVPEDKMLENKMNDEEKNRVSQAIKIMKHFEDNLILYHMPDPNIEQLNSNVRKLAIQYQLDVMFK